MLISEDVTWSFSDQDLADAKGQLRDAVTGLAGSPIPVNMQVTTFGQVAPVADTAAFTTPDGRPYPAAVNASTGVFNVSDAAAGAALADKVARFGFDGLTSSFTNWESALLRARELADAQGTKNVLFVTDGVPNSYIGPDGQPTNNGGWYDPAATAAAKRVADQMRADGYNIVPAFIRTERPGYHGLDDPDSPVSQATLEEAMQALQPGWTIDQAFATCTPGITLEKTHQKPVDKNGNGLVDAGDEVTFVFTGRNSGNLPLSNVQVTDATLAGLGVGLVNDGKVGDLAVGQEYQVLSKPYTITEQDVKAGQFHNVATVKGDSPKGPVTDEDPDDVPTEFRNGLTIDKSHQAADVTDVNKNGITDAGDTVVFTFTGKNTGSTTLQNVQVTDEKLAKAGVKLEKDGKVGTLTPGQTYSLRSQAYTLTQADVDGGKFVNVACVIGDAPVGDKPKACDEDTVPVDPKPGIDLEKWHAGTDVTDVNGNGRTDEGDQVVFTFDVTNTGNVTLKDVPVTDEILAKAGVKLEGSGRLGTLAPGEKKTVRSDAYTITKADVEAGQFHNVATATGKPPVGPDPKDTDDDNVPTDPAPAPVVPSAPKAHTGGPLADMNPVATTGVVAGGVALLAAAAVGGAFALRKRRADSTAAETAVE